MLAYRLIVSIAGVVTGTAFGLLLAHGLEVDTPWPIAIGCFIGLIVAETVHLSIQYDLCECRKERKD